MSELTMDEFEASRARGEARLRTVPHASCVHYDAASGTISIGLANGCAFTFPVAIVPDLNDASVAELGDVEIIASGEGLHWPQLDVDLSVPNLLAGLFGTRSHQARRAGATRSAAKADAARKNGLKGGRPRRATA